MISGIRNAPPISTSSPRDTTASPLRASADRATSRAPAALFTTMASSAPVNSTRRSRQSAWREPRVPWARSYSRFEYPVAMRAIASRGARERRPAKIGVQHHAGRVDHRQEGRGREALHSRADGRAPALGGRGAAVGARVLDRVSHGAHHQAPRMGGDERRDVGLGEHGLHRGQPAPGVAGVAGVGHGFLALVVSRGAGFGTGISTTARPSVATPLKLIAPCTRTRYFAPGVNNFAVWTTSRS